LRLGKEREVVLILYRDLRTNLKYDVVFVPSTEVTKGKFLMLGLARGDYLYRLSNQKCLLLEEQRQNDVVRVGLRIVEVSR
jgi:hypothetical protein